MGDACLTRLQKNFAIMKFFDDARWENFRDPLNLHEECKKYENDIAFKILVHWITYIGERGSDFRPIWDKGSYVYSYYLKDYCDGKKNTLDIFEPCESDGDGYLKKIDIGKEKKYFWCAPNNQENERLEKYQESDNQIKYKSRYYTTDYICAALTLSVLEDEKYDRNLLTYLNEVIKIAEEAFPNDTETVEADYYLKSMALALYCLTYDDLNGLDCDKIKAYKFDGISAKQYTRDIFEAKGASTSKGEREELYKNHKANLEKLLNEANFKSTYERFYGSELRHEFKSMKRVWCALRDYIRDDEHYGKAFIEKVFKDTGIDQDTIDNMVRYIELPGDVWNNNSTFGQCLFADAWVEYRGRYNKEFKKKDENESYTLNRLLRVIYNDENGGRDAYGDCWPECFDCTFDFVPRMCDTGENCKFCPFNKEKDPVAEFEKYCVFDSQRKKDEKSMPKKCTIAKICCGYDADCEGSKCKLREILGLTSAGE